jgi:hypothetical protein
MREIEIEQQNLAVLNGTTIPSIRMFIKRDFNDDPRRYNLPNCNEIAVVFVGENGEPPIDRDFIVYPRSSNRTTINYLSPNCDPMSYPLFFPHGEKG